MPAGKGCRQLTGPGLEYQHRKLVFNDAPWPPFFFADIYRFGYPSPDPRPLVYYIGGAGDARRYEDRVKTEPTIFLDEFGNAMAACEQAAVDLIISPAPLTAPEHRATRLDDFHAFFLTTLIPAAIGGLPPAVGLVGSAYGSFFASYLAFMHEECRALALISGMGMTQAHEKSGKRARRSLAIACYSNADDEIRSWTDEFAAIMKGQGVDLTVIRRPGDRRFDDYHANGSVRDAFAHVLQHIG